MEKKKLNLKLAVFGLGYVGLPLAIEFGKKRHTIGFDVDGLRVRMLKDKSDLTGEVSKEEFESAKYINFTANLKETAEANCYIVAVPTPITQNKQPDLTILKNVCELIGSVLSTGDLVIFESTVYPGTTEEVCVPILQETSGLVYNCSFFCGYSPERINPGDKSRRITDIKKITSGSNKMVAEIVDELYKEIILAGTHPVESIKIAEAAKVIENTQRDINIALVNELSLIFNKMGIDTEAVLDAAKTKWNFVPFLPGLVGGHCIGVDPYYLTYKAQILGYSPDIILAGRRLNDSMATYVASRLVKEMSAKNISVGGGRVLLMGLTFKENCPDIRNSKSFDIITELLEFGCQVDVYDPWVSKDTVVENGFRFVNFPNSLSYNAVIISVAHDCFKNMGIEKIKQNCEELSIIFDLKWAFKKDETDLRL